MNEGKTIFSQAMEFLPMYEFRKCIERYRGDYKVKSFSCLDQFLCMAFAQMTFRESLRDIQACLRSRKNKLYHMGIRGRVSRNTLANANNQRDWRIYADFAMILIYRARALYINDPFGVELDNTVYALDSTTIKLCLALFPWAHSQQNAGAVKLHTLMDLRGSIPSFIDISDGKVHDVNVLDLLTFEAGSFYIMDRGYIDYSRLHQLHQAGAFFVIRAKSNIKYRRRYSRPVDRTTGLRCDQTIILTDSYADYPEQLRRIKYYDPANDLYLTFLTNNFALPALTITQLYKCRWRIELFFKWVKQHLRIKAFFGTSENAVKTQIWIAVTVYVLIAIIKKRLALEPSLYTILQILSVNIFEKEQLPRLLTREELINDNPDIHNQLELF